MKRTQRIKLWSIGKWLIAALLALFVATFAMASLLFGPQTALRALAWGEADVYDHLKFSSRPLEPASRVFHFKEAYAEAQIRALFEVDRLIDDLEGFLESTRTQAFLVIQDDRLLYEGYFNGTQRDSIVTSFSVAKSFDSALIGIAIAEGHIESVEDPVTKYIPELGVRDPHFKEIKVRDLLRMASGLRYAEGLPHGDDVRTYSHPDLRGQALTQTEILEPPGDRFLYNNYNPLLLGIILERATGQWVTDYLQEKLWEPIGMEFPGSWSIDSMKSGFEKMESGINARAIDFAKFGRLYLNLGRWEGVRIVPEGWVLDSTQAAPAGAGGDYYADEFGQHILGAAGGGYYGYMWYGLQRPGGLNDFFATGAKGQYIYVSPQADLVIVRHGEDYGVDMFDWIDIFDRFASGLKQELGPDLP